MGVTACIINQTENGESGLTQESFTMRSAISAIPASEHHRIAG